MEVEESAEIIELVGCLRSQTLTDNEFLEKCQAIVAETGSAALTTFSAKDKHKSRLIHFLVSWNKPESIRGLSPYLNINEQRSSDQCTPLHLSAWTKNPELTELLLELGADPLIKNKYGENTEDLVKNVTQKSNIAFLDLELTDLPSAVIPPEILEIAVIITDKDLNELSRGQWIINPGPKALASISEFGMKTFATTEEGGNNLLQDIDLSGIPFEDAKKELLEMLQLHCPSNLCPLGGYSVHCDREVLKERMREVYDHMSHQIIDVSTVSQLCNRWGGLLHEHYQSGNRSTSTAHRAMYDTEHAISTLSFIRKTIFDPKSNNTEGMSAGKEKKTPE